MTRKLRFNVRQNVRRIGFTERKKSINASASVTDNECITYGLGDVAITMQPKVKKKETLCTFEMIKETGCGSEIKIADKDANYEFLNKAASRVCINGIEDNKLIKIFAVCTRLFTPHSLILALQFAPLSYCRDFTDGNQLRSIHLFSFHFYYFVISSLHSIRRIYSLLTHFCSTRKHYSFDRVRRTCVEMGTSSLWNALPFDFCLRCHSYLVRYSCWHNSIRLAVIL